MAPEFDPLETTWEEVVDQELLTLGRGERTCGSTTHVDLCGPCRYCRAAL